MIARGARSMRPIRSLLIRASSDIGAMSADFVRSPTFARRVPGALGRVIRRLAEGGAATATELADHFPISRQAVVKHLSALGHAGLVAGEREGREVRYRLTPAPLEDGRRRLREDMVKGLEF